MSAQTEPTLPQIAPSPFRPIELVTENGFAILRPWEIERTSPPAGRFYRFIVRDPQNSIKEVTVEIATEAALVLDLRARLRVSSCNHFWITCAERHLANHLAETDESPEKLMVKILDPEECLMAFRWQVRD
jgi:hypothetical protein